MWITRQIEGLQKDCVSIQAAKQETLAKPPLPPPLKKKTKTRWGKEKGKGPQHIFMQKILQAQYCNWLGLIFSLSNNFIGIALG